jgi:hypothetical protein
MTHVMRKDTCDTSNTGTSYCAKWTSGDKKRNKTRRQKNRLLEVTALRTSNLM